MIVTEKLCPECGGSGKVDGDVCPRCAGDGYVTTVTFSDEEG